MSRTARLSPGRRTAASISALALAAVGTLAHQSTGATAGSAALSGPTASGNASDEWPITECGTFSGHGCAPTSGRVDLVRPTFSDPTRIDNPLFPASQVGSVIQVGTVDGKPFRSETTTLPQTGVVDWYGTKVPVLLSQYVAYLDGNLEEVALDRYAQADDGSVWYFGEDVIDYRHGRAYFTEGTWLAGRDGPPAMLMPAKPALGDVYRVENVIGIVFEELTVIKQDLTLPGPNGPVHGAIVVDELGADGGHSTKTLAPGYGEFLTRNDTELEAMAVAVPTDSLPGGAPAEIRKVLTAAWGTLEYARAGDWQFARSSLGRIQDQLAAVSETQQPPRVLRLLRGAVGRLEDAVHARRSLAAQQATVDVAQSAIDLEARYLDPVEIEVARFHLHSQQLRVDAAAGDRGGVHGDVATLRWVRDRIADQFDKEELASIDHGLAALSGAASAGNLQTAADLAIGLAADVRNLVAT